ncbi:CRISPR-associated endonuclease Cas1 [Gloeobacter morelensis]|uniref:CRISPR-associated endonuclease Cas1 n=1 Tax=Gloeobacter morelensis MG652769 TaxID=2781736 RepID=A0ABY3PIU7_9CYAN|nr:CRISPR-associated endonuclease Cas1 [Gloeobacter morelensis]UFP93595.1 CRISPR-associated endonuclease Cas1 [Gloeobacter morelensis MG652769]
MASLYLLEQGSQVGKQAEQLVITQQQRLLRQVPLAQIERLFLFGRIHLTADVVRTCLVRRIPAAYLSRQGWLYGTVSAPFAGRSRQRFLQWQANSDPGCSLAIARTLVAAKIHNQRVLLMRQQRRRAVSENELAVQILAYLEERVVRANSVQQLFGLEGAAAAQYFPAFGRQLQDGRFRLVERVRRPPTNPVNALLSFGYSLLWNHLRAVVEVYGLDPYPAHLHALDDGHLALISDLIEPFRAPIVDSLVITLINRRMLDESHFDYVQGSCYLGDVGRRLVIAQFEQYMAQTIQLPNEREGYRWELLDWAVRTYRDSLYRNQELVAYRIR